MKLELRHLRIVCAIAEAGSITRAAGHLGLAQPALAAQLKRIERMMGGPLFERSRHGVRPTPLGQLVLDRARLLLPAMRTLEEEAAQLTRQEGGMSRYRLGTMNGPLLSGVVRRLTATQPTAVLTTRFSWNAVELAAAVATDRLDFALVGVCGDAAPPGAELSWALIAVDAVFVLLPESHPLASQPAVELRELASAQWAMAPGDSCFRSCFAAACARAGFAPRDVYESDVRTCVELVEAGSAVSLCQSSFRPPPGLVGVPIAGTPLRWRHLLGWKPGSPAAGQATRISDCAVAAYRDAVTRLPRTLDWFSRQPGLGARPQPPTTPSI